MSGGYQQHGAVWERWIESECATAYELKLARAFKVPHPVDGVRVLRGGKVEGRLAAARWLDFIGYLCGSGRCMTFDAKATKEDRWSLSDLAPHQLEKLQTSSADGALAFVYLAHMDDRHILGRYILPLVDGELLGVSKGHPCIFARSEAYKVHSLPHYLAGLQDGR